ncbi:MAG TPA: glycosyltransferase family 2 protein [Actinobacteria bacterium]|nr:glycosyltransferase family 2 protein [Actinomycetota bacterium]
MCDPKLSVGMPVFNGEAFLAQAIDSILAQTFSEFELIISDNGSTDGTEQICRHYARIDDRVAYFRQSSNLGAAANYNFVFHKATGRYFKWASHDDLIAPTMLEQCVGVLDSDFEDVILAYPKTRLDHSDGTAGELYEDRLDLGHTSPHERLYHLVSNVTLCNAVFGVIRSDALRKTRLIGAFASSDEVLLAELALLGRFREVPEYLFVRRLHQDRSVVAHSDPQDRTAWFDPNARHKRYLHRTTVLVEDIKSVLRSRLTLPERLRSVTGLLRGYLPRWWRVMAREVQHAVFP